MTWQVPQERTRHTSTKGLPFGSMKNDEKKPQFFSLRFQVFAWRPRTICLFTTFLLFTYVCIILSCLQYSELFDQRESQPKPIPAIQKPSTFPGSACPIIISNNSISPIKGTRNLMVSAFLNEEANGQVRIITIMERSHSEPFTCIFCCEQHRFNTSSVILEKHRDYFGFPFETTDAICRIEPTCSATHVTISRPENLLEKESHLYLPIHTSPRQGMDFDVNFTLCISSLFGNYNNVLQFVQTIETYKLLGVERVVIYNTSCGPDLEKVLHSYKEDRMLEIIPWPIHHFLKPSKGWKFEKHPGEVHYYGQKATLNDCIHRNRQRSRYVLLNDVDEIIMPYRHSNLHQLMSELQESNRQAATFRFREHTFSTKETSDSDKFDLPQWRHIPGINILRHIYREPLDYEAYIPTKMIINPRKVTQTSVHEVLESSGESIIVPDDMAIVRHTAKPHRPDLRPDNGLTRDITLWKYAESLIPNVNEMLQKSGLLNTTWQTVTIQ